ncbi:SDR family NAD(P)-dependent oxidoreductase [Stenotrophomonas sp. 24(2023)]|uniref:SDR family oxidoreductase n=1 Tax=Stenotrophomonas sp. 24(2023) TaxID=3068324 RepID=UPI0027DEB72D|nr:SDR family NAD(P)-dependent oxidoreductase [Stenotrophomonas sp. 24(2023)]WMJ68801.1 SDR family NAD(P)-dependent oxidoreductase [Stenotrophomonas sp. 24(2023)]
MNLSNNTILITGGTSGIGLELARQLLAAGNTVLITGRSASRLAEVRSAVPALHTFICDQRDPASIVSACRSISETFPSLNMLINNAGIGRKRNLNETDRPLDDLEDEIRTNLTGPIQLINQLLPLLKRQQRATIVNVTSGLAFVPMALKPIYCATKAAMHSYTQSLRVQLAKTRVKVVELAPPATGTAFNTDQQDMNAHRQMDVATLCRAALRGLEKERDEVLPGASRLIRLIGRISPRTTFKRADAEQMGTG